MTGMAIGIDLGTTNSVASLKKINVSTLRNAEGEELTPSSVTAIPHANGSYEFVVGRHSRDLLKQYPKQTVTSVKRLMGRDFEDIEVQNIIHAKRVSYPIITEASEPGSIRIPLGGKMRTPEMISGMILNKLIRDGEAELQGKITQAVVTVPAYFSDRQKFATRAACDYAGFKLLRLLPEPTAAALSFALEDLDKNESRTVMVFDLGGGTFDVSVLSFSGGSFMEVTKGGDMWLGGDNIDSLLVDYIVSCVQKAAHCKSIRELIEKLSPDNQLRFQVEMKEKAEAAKIALSSEESATVEMFGILKDEKNKLIDIDVTIERPQFDQLLQPIVQRVSQITKQILYEIRFEPELIDTVLMVGGSSLIPAIQDELRNLFGKDKVMVHPRPMLAVSEGAALMAAKMIGEDTAENPLFSMMHSTAHDYYLQLAGGKRHLLVARNTPLPITVEQKLEFAHREQSLARLRVFNEVEGVLDVVGELWFHKATDFDLSKNKTTELMLRFSVDEDNIITMKAWSLQGEQRCVEAQIARGGLASKLYNDLEQALSFIIANCSTKGVEKDALDLSRSIVSTILSASNPMTGETNVEQKLKAQSQINTLKGFQQKEFAPLGMYRFALLALKGSENLLAPEEKLRLENIVKEFKQSLEDLGDITKLESLKKELEQFYEDWPIVADLGRAESAASALEVNYASEAKQLRRYAKELSDSYIKKNENQVEIARDALYDFMSMISWHDVPTGRFDRDVVCL